MNDSSDRAPGTLLYELESIQNLLAEQGDDLGSIPILRDIVSESSKPSIVRASEHSIPSTLAIEKNQPHKEHNYERDLLIQEVVDEFIPAIEASLREKLQQLTDEELEAMLKNN